MFFNYSKPEHTLSLSCHLGQARSFQGENPLHSVEAREEENHYRPGPPRPLSEKLLKCLWFDKRFSQPLETLAGKKITLLSPGWWNKSAGPDFLNATFMDEEGRVLKGNVELHVLKGDWKRHGHAGDNNYEGLALHVFFRNDGGPEETSQTLQIEIAPFLSRAVEDFRAEVDPDAYPMVSKSVLGGCCPVLRERPSDRLASLLETAGEERLRERSDVLLKRLGPGGFDQLMYEGLLEALGYGQNARAFLSLAQKLPWDLLRRQCWNLSPEARFEMAHSLLLTASRLMPDGKEKANSPPGKAETRWNLVACRPFNHPRVRMAGAAALMEKFWEEGPFRFFRDKISAVMATDGRSWKKLNRELVLLLTAEAPPDFASTYPISTGDKSNRPRKLIGVARAAEILVNTVFPVLMAAAAHGHERALVEKVLSLYFHFPLLPENSVQRFMNTYLLGERYRRSPLLNSARRQQGLIQIYKKFCLSNAKGCLDCGFLSLLN